MGILLIMFGESHFDFLKESEVLSRDNRSKIDSRQAIFQLNVMVLSNNYKGVKNHMEIRLQAATICPIFSFVLS